MSPLETSALTLPAPDELPDGQVRISLLPHVAGEPSLLDGAWWPRGRELSLEVPLLATEFAKTGVRITRVIYYPSTWQVAPPKVTVDGHRIHLGWFREIDPHLVSLRTGNDQRIDLLVIPAETDPAVAARAMVLASTARNELSPTEVLAAALAP
jgi:hypothetical protein